MITFKNISDACTIFSHLYNSNYEDAYEKKKAIYASSGEEIYSLDVIESYAPDDNYARHVFKRNENTRFDFIIRVSEFKKLDLSKCFICVYYTENVDRSVIGLGPFEKIDTDEIEYLKSQLPN